MTDHATQMHWIAEPSAGVREATAPLLSHLASCRGGWPQDERADWFGWSCVKFGPQAFVFEYARSEDRLFMKWLPRILLTKRRRGLAIWPTPALQHARWTERMRSLGVDVVDLLAAGLQSRTPIDLRQTPSFIVTASVHGARTLRDALLDDDLSINRRTQIAEAVEEIVARLHDARIRRVDLRPANLLINPTGARVTLFDFDSFRYDRTMLGSALARHRAKDMEKVARTKRMLLGQEALPEKWKAQRSRNLSVSQT